MTLKDTDELIELIDDDIASLNKDTSRESYVCLCTLKMVKLYIETLPTVALDWKSLMDDWTEHDNAMIAKGRELERRLNAPKHGRWIEIDKYHLGTCSVCGDRWGSVEIMRYCPNCGARMDEVGNGNTD